MPSHMLQEILARKEVIGPQFGETTLLKYQDTFPNTVGSLDWPMMRMNRRPVARDRSRMLIAPFYCSDMTSAR